MLVWELDKTRPICPQICEQLSVLIAAEEFKPDEKLLSVREVAVKAGVNPNTVQKAFEQLEGQGLIYSVRGSGWFVGADTESAKNTVEELKYSKTKDYINEMKKLGFSAEQVKEYIKEWSE